MTYRIHLASLDPVSLGIVAGLCTILIHALAVNATAPLPVRGILQRMWFRARAAARDRQDVKTLG